MLCEIEIQSLSSGQTESTVVNSLDNSVLCTFPCLPLRLFNGNRSDSWV